MSGKRNGLREATQNLQPLPTNVSWFVFSGGGEQGMSTTCTIEATLGQPIVDRRAGVTTQLTAGFWQTENTSGYRFFLPIALK